MSFESTLWFDPSDPNMKPAAAGVPGIGPSVRTARRTPGSFLVEFSLDQLYQGIRRLARIVPRDRQSQSRALRRRQKHHLHGALAVYDRLIRGHLHLRRELCGRVHKLHDRARMQTLRIEDRHLTLDLIGLRLRFKHVAPHPANAPSDPRPSTGTLWYHKGPPRRRLLAAEAFRRSGQAAVGFLDQIHDPFHGARLTKESPEVILLQMTEDRLHRLQVFVRLILRTQQ